MAPFLFASLAFAAVILFIVAVVIKRNRNANFLKNLPASLPAEIILWKNKSGKDIPWYELKGRSAGAPRVWLTLLKKSVSSIDSTQITKVDFVFYMPVTGREYEKTYEDLFPIITKANKGRVVPDDPNKIFKGDETERRAKNRIGFFSPQLMIAPYLEIFGENQTPLESQSREWILRAIFPFKPDLDYLKSCLRLLDEAL